MPPVDRWVVHEVTHVFEFQRGEPVDEHRTNWRTHEFMSSKFYADWLMENY
jgi:hypothetical protein